MPPIKSASRAAVSKNIETELAAGKPLRVARAIALSTADRAKEGKVAKKQEPMKTEAFGQGGYQNSVDEFKRVVTGVDEGNHDIGAPIYRGPAGARPGRIVPAGGSEPTSALNLQGKKRPISEINAEVEQKNIANRGKRFARQRGY